MRQRSLKSRITDPSETTLAWVLLTPAILFLLLIVAYPVSKLIYNSFFDIRLSGGGVPSFVGLDNYKLALEDSLFWKSLKNTIIITVVTVPGALVAGLGLAMLANMPFKYRWPVRLALLLPWALPLAFRRPDLRVVLPQRIRPGERHHPPHRPAVPGPGLAAADLVQFAGADDGRHLHHHHLENLVVHGADPAGRPADHSRLAV